MTVREMAQWWICPWDNQVTVDDASVMGIDCSAIPKNVNLIWWYGSEGEILYKDRLGIREPFTDFAPYVRFFDAFIRAAQTAPRPITVAQAKFIKLKMLDALFAQRKDQHAQHDHHKNRIANLTTVQAIANYNLIDGW
jgi:hypothetical protein